jgi:hypothetical protein
MPRVLLLASLHDAKVNQPNIAVAIHEGGVKVAGPEVRKALSHRLGD